MFELLIMAAGISVQLSGPNGPVLPAEPLALIARWHSSAAQPRMRIWGSTFLGDNLALQVENGSTSRLYREYAGPETEAIQATHSWPAGKKLRQHLVLVHGRFDGESTWMLGPFPMSGSYRVRLVYADPSHGIEVQSNWIPVQVAEPDGDDAVVLRGLREGREGGELFRLFPNSRYFSLSRLRALEGQVHDVTEGRSAETGERVQLHERALLDWKMQQFRELLQRFLDEADRGEPLEGLALERALGLAGTVRDGQREAGIRGRLRDRFPGLDDETYDEN